MRDVRNNVAKNLQSWLSGVVVVMRTVVMDPGVVLRSDCEVRTCICKIGQTPNRVIPVLNYMGPAGRPNQPHEQWCAWCLWRKDEVLRTSTGPCSNQ